MCHVHMAATIGRVSHSSPPFVPSVSPDEVTGSIESSEGPQSPTDRGNEYLRDMRAPQKSPGATGRANKHAFPRRDSGAESLGARFSEGANRTGTYVLDAEDNHTVDKRARGTSPLHISQWGNRPFQCIVSVCPSLMQLHLLRRKFF